MAKKPAPTKSAPGQLEAAAWLLKSEPAVFSFSDLLAAPGRRTGWDGVRNYQARNYLRNGLRLGALVLFYHSNSEPPGIVGTARVVAAARPDPTQFDPRSEHFDPSSDPAEPRWLEVEIQAEAAWAKPLTLPELRAEPRLAGLPLLAKGSRLSVLPVGPEHLAVILEMASTGPAGPTPSQKSATRGASGASREGSRGAGGGSRGSKT